MNSTRRSRSVWCLLLAWVSTLALAQTPARLGNLTYRVPPGWTTQTRNGVLTLTPRDLPSGQTAFILLSPDAPLTGELRPWFEARVRGLHGKVRVLNTTAVEAARAKDGSTVLSQGAVVVGGSGEPQYRFYVAGEFGQGAGRRAVFLLYQASSLDLVGRYQAGLNALADSVDLAGTAVAATPGAPTPRPPTPAGAATRPTPSPTPSPGATLPAVRTLNAAEFVKAGGNPRETLIPGEFRCYEERRGDDVARPHLTVQILPGGGYRTSGGGGTFSVRKDGSLRKVRWQGGPLGGSSEGYLGFGDHGQDFSLGDVGPQERDYECYQAGARENLARLEFSLKTPKPGKYPCVTGDGSNKGAGTLEILPGGRYRLGGGEGRYAVDLLSDQNEDWSDLEFAGGSLDGASGSYSEGEDGEREFSVFRPKVTCRLVVKPTPIPRYGTAKAPTPPRGSGGLSGAYASWQADVGGYCGGLCWSFYIFDKNGYVYTDEPETGLEDADCSRTRPNGLPVCEVYSFRGGQLTIGDGKPEPLRKKADGNYDLDGTTLTAIRPVTGLKLGGKYRSFSGSVSPGGMTSSFSEVFLRFLPDGRFSREAAGGASSTFTDNGTSSGTTTGGVTATGSRSNGGTYRFAGNTLELKYADGRVSRSFAFLPEMKGGQPNKGFVHLGGRDYSLQDGK
ncbi:hypothetical protein DAETH_35700 (plasmid) [Deinococcus aetherius]|uniref:Uncharacterized protein n=1 Tax=Deinococcus aetherius TaxID=200252 RepID=A0ABM8AIH8_9DEIO|nr:hypothetical protein [Deinococcus aetherius]BDP43601.1 hypothetical protein DAETH_35700 [Deinococcus aetherius]